MSVRSALSQSLMVWSSPPTTFQHLEGKESLRNPRHASVDLPLKSTCHFCFAVTVPALKARRHKNAHKNRKFSLVFMVYPCADVLYLYQTKWGEMDSPCSCVS